MRKKKGSEIEYSTLKLVDYLTSSNTYKSIEEKQELFAYRNEMNNIPINFKNQGSEAKCSQCNTEETMKHIWKCIEIKDEIDNNIQYDRILNGSLKS